MSLDPVPSLPNDEHFWSAGYTWPLVFVSISLARMTDTRTVILAHAIQNLCTASYIPRIAPTKTPARDDIRDDVKMHGSVVPTPIR